MEPKAVLLQPGRGKMIVMLMLAAASLWAQTSQSGSRFTIARLKYSGGGDWYNDPSAIPNLAAYIASHTAVAIAPDEARLPILDESLFTYPFLFLTGHGSVAFDDIEAARLRDYLLQGGFLYADDDYGLDDSFRKAMKKVFPSKELIDLPFTHEIYRIQYRFSRGLPKIHEHDNKPPRGLGLFDESGRLMVFYTYETNISDGWADADVHQDTPEKREQALQMGVNIVLYALMH